MTKNNLETATLAGGCFWCLEASFQLVAGVETVVSGYAGGHTVNPTYEEVCAETTGHAECVQLSFDPSIITFPELLEIFWIIHNPTTLNRQGNDVGESYRSAIFYENEEQKRQAEASKAEVQPLWPDKIVTEIVLLEKLWPAEDYHQNYFNNHPAQAYCQAVINPKLVKLREHFEARLKPGV
jgi:peptide-methionine (S)-S-oxide reductase